MKARGNHGALKRSLPLLLLFALTGCGGKGVAPENASEVVKVREPASAPNAAWFTFHGDAGLTGYVAWEPPDVLALRWRYASGSEIVNTPVAGNGRIYCANTRGMVFAVDLKGREIWSRTLMRPVLKKEGPQPEALDAPLLYHEGRVIVAAADGALYALDGATGKVAWQVEMDATFLGSPTYGKGRIYLVTQDEGVLQARSVETGALLWKSEAVARCDGSPSVGADFAAFGSCDAALHVRSLEDGGVLFDIPIDDDSQIAGGVAIDGKAVFSGSRSGAVVHANGKTGKIVWMNRDSRDEIFTTPAVTKDWVIVASQDGMIYGLNRATGKQRWRFDTEGEPMSPVITGEKVVVTADGTLFLLRLKDGEELWSCRVSDEITAPAIVGDMVVVGCDDGTVAVFGAP